MTVKNFDLDPQSLMKNRVYLCRYLYFDASKWQAAYSSTLSLKRMIYYECTERQRVRRWSEFRESTSELILTDVRTVRGLDRNWPILQTRVQASVRTLKPGESSSEPIFKLINSSILQLTPRPNILNWHSLYSLDRNHFTDEMKLFWMPTEILK